MELASKTCLDMCTSLGILDVSQKGDVTITEYRIQCNGACVELKDLRGVGNGIFIGIDSNRTSILDAAANQKSHHNSQQTCCFPVSHKQSNKLGFKMV